MKKIYITINKPFKSDRDYYFDCTVQGAQLSLSEFRRRLGSMVKGYGSLFKAVIRFGFHMDNSDIQHHEVWDSIYPLMYLTRNGGPLFQEVSPHAILKFEYPVLDSIVRFFIDRASHQGIQLEVDAPARQIVTPFLTQGSSISFGGGKDSRLILGILDELGRCPQVYTAYHKGIEGLSNVKTSVPYHGVLANRFMPALMSRAEHLYFGSGLGEVANENPWHQYYDLASSFPTNDFSNLLKQHGIETTVHVPACILPYNIIQKILYERYPDIYKHQYSVEPGVASEKNLHIALLKLHHNIDFSDHCPVRLFIRLLNRFVQDQTAAPENFGKRRVREVINREMRAIIFANQDHKLISPIKAFLPRYWHGEWINCIHTYANPYIEPEFLNIFLDYAPELSDFYSRDTQKLMIAV